MALVLQARDQLGLAGRFHLPVEDLAVRIQCLVTVGRHVSPVVLRASAFLGDTQDFLDGRLPTEGLGQASYIVRMPASRAMRSISPMPSRRITARRSASFITRNSMMVVRPR